MGMAEAGKYLKDDLELGIKGQGRTGAEVLQQVSTAKQLHHDVGRSVCVITEIENGHDIWIYQAGRSPALSFKTSFLLRIVGELGEHDLEGNRTSRHITVP
jgi:hypothetical protein